MDRRTFLGVAAGTALTAAAPAAALPAGRLGMSDVAGLHSELDDLATLDDTYGGAGLAPVAATGYRRIRAALERCTYGPRVEQALYAAAAEFAVSAAWYAFDAGDDRAVTHHGNMSLRLSSIAGDAVLQARTWNVMALQAIKSRRPAEALALARTGAASQAARKDPWFASLFQARIASAHAITRDTAAADKALARAHSFLSRAESSPTPWLAFYGPSEVAGLSAIVRLKCGQYAQAGEGLKEAISLVPDTHQRNRTYYRSALPRTLLGQRRVDEACGAASEILDALAGVRSSRAFSHLDTFINELHPWLGRVPQAREFAARYANTTRTA